MGGREDHKWVAKDKNNEQIRYLTGMLIKEEFIMLIR